MERNRDEKNVCCEKGDTKRGVRKITPDFEAFLRSRGLLQYLQTEESNSTCGGFSKKAKRIKLEKRFKEAKQKIVD